MEQTQEQLSSANAASARSVWWFEMEISDPTMFDAIELHGVADRNMPGDPRGTNCEIDDANPTFFSVFAHCVGGGLECVGDFETIERARAYAKTLSEKFGWAISDYQQ